MIATAPLIGFVPGLIEALVGTILIHSFYLVRYKRLCPLSAGIISVIGFQMVCILVSAALLTVGIG